MAKELLHSELFASLVMGHQKNALNYSDGALESVSMFNEELENLLGGVRDFVNDRALGFNVVHGDSSAFAGVYSENDVILHCSIALKISYAIYGIIEFPHAFTLSLSNPLGSPLLIRKRVKSVFLLIRLKVDGSSISLGFRSGIIFCKIPPSLAIRMNPSLLG